MTTTADKYRARARANRLLAFRFRPATAYQLNPENNTNSDRLPHLPTDYRQRQLLAHNPTVKVPWRERVGLRRDHLVYALDSTYRRVAIAIMRPFRNLAAQLLMIFAPLSVSI